MSKKGIYEGFIVIKDRQGPVFQVLGEDCEKNAQGAGATNV
jgi:hypothetical protein